MAVDVWAQKGSPTLSAYVRILTLRTAANKPELPKKDRHVLGWDGK